MGTATMTTTSPAAATLHVWSTTGSLLVTDPTALPTARRELDRVLDEIDGACSRFRADSEISRIVAAPGRSVTLSPVLNAVLEQALRVAAATDGAVDPTVAAAVIDAGYDRDIADVLTAALDGAPADRGWGGPAPGVGTISHDAQASTMFLPPGVGLDLGATAKAFAADLAVRRITAVVDGGVLVSLGGDVAVAGPAPEGGWRIAVADDHRSTGTPLQTVGIRTGGLATSSTTVRRWPTATGWRHHIVDPRTGRNPDSPWRTVSVAAGSCVDANAAATAAIVLGDDAPGWLADRGLPALLVDGQGMSITVAGWPDGEGN